MHHLILPKLVQLVLNQGLEPLARLRVLWPALVGEPLGGLTAPQRLLDGQLYVQAQTQDAAMLMQERAQEILGRMESQGVLPEYPGLGGVGVRVSVVGGGKRGGWGGQAEGSSGAIDDLENLEKIGEIALSVRLRGALGGVEDEALRAQLERILFRDLGRRTKRAEGRGSEERGGVASVRGVVGGVIDPWGGRW